MKPPMYLLIIAIYIAMLIASSMLSLIQFYGKEGKNKWLNIPLYLCFFLWIKDISKWLRRKLTNRDH